MSVKLFATASVEEERARFMLETRLTLIGSGRRTPADVVGRLRRVILYDFHRLPALNVLCADGARTTTQQ
jgi:hypothetical protein